MMDIFFVSGSLQWHGAPVLDRGNTGFFGSDKISSDENVIEAVISTAAAIFGEWSSAQLITLYYSLLTFLLFSSVIMQ
jgi:hypothetical protein